jgi:hypothetical protein
VWSIFGFLLETKKQVWELKGLASQSKAESFLHIQLTKVEYFPKDLWTRVNQDPPAHQSGWM